MLDGILVEDLCTNNRPSYSALTQRYKNDVSNGILFAVSNQIVEVASATFFDQYAVVAVSGHRKAFQSILNAVAGHITLKRKLHLIFGYEVIHPISPELYTIAVSDYLIKLA